MKNSRTSLINLLWLYLIFSEDHSGYCFDTVWQPPIPSISHLRAVNDKQSLVVSWLVNHSGLVGDINEIQISRTENHTVIYNKNISALPADSHEYTWTWTSDLPLECVDHSVRIRHFYNRSLPSPWSEWVTNYGDESNDEPNIFPFDRVLREGTSAMFCCVPRVGFEISSFTFHDRGDPLISIGSRVKAIAVDNVTFPKSKSNAMLLLTCSDTSGKTEQQWNFVSSPPQKPRNLSCATEQMTTVTCTWDPDRDPQKFNQNKQTRTLHLQNSDQAPINCEPSSCTFPAVPQLEEYNIRVVLKNQVGEETERYSFNISERVFPVVEIDRVSPGGTNTNVSWFVQGNLTQLNFLCQITVDPDSNTELSCNSVNAPCKVKLENLLPNTRYSTRVRCSVNGRFWGKWTQPVSFKTCPIVTLNLWRRIEQMSDPNSRQVTLLWTVHVPGSAANVNIQDYEVQWSQEGLNRTEWKDGGQTQAEVSIGPGQCSFTVRAVLDTGPSIPACISIPARITIPKLDDGENLRVEKRLNSSKTEGFSLSWAEQDTATCGYTVEWCVRGNEVPCTLRWIHMPEGNNTLLLPTGNFIAGRRYTFNIYGCTGDGHNLMEIQAGYSRELAAVQSPSLVESVESTLSSVTLEWRYNEDDPAHLAFITGYLVTVQEGHTANKFNLSLDDPRQKSVTVKDLKPSHEYVISVRALTKVGPGQAASITIRTRINYPVHLAIVLTPILILLGCTILLWPQRKMLKRGLKEIFVYPAGMNIKTSELDSFLRESIERIQSHKVEECISCDIEILNTCPALNETTTLGDAEPLNTPPSLGSQSSTSSLPLSQVLLQDYYPQSPIPLFEGPAPQQTTSITNKNYFFSMVEDYSEPHTVTFIEIKPSFESSDCLQELYTATYGYISNENL